MPIRRRQSPQSAQRPAARLHAAHQVRRGGDAGDQPIACRPVLHGGADDQNVPQPLWSQEGSPTGHHHQTGVPIILQLRQDPLQVICTCMPWLRGPPQCQQSCSLDSVRGSWAECGTCVPGLVRLQSGPTLRSNAQQQSDWRWATSRMHAPVRPAPTSNSSAAAAAVGGAWPLPHLYPSHAGSTWLAKQLPQQLLPGACGGSGGRVHAGQGHPAQQLCAAAGVVQQGPAGQGEVADKRALRCSFTGHGLHTAHIVCACLPCVVCAD